MKNSKSQFFNTREETIEWLDKYCIENYIINKDLSVDVNGDVIISYQNLKVIPVKFGKVTGSFLCNGNSLTSLAGSSSTFALPSITFSSVRSPEFVGCDFWCQNNKLIDLTGAPKIVGGNFWCQGNKLTNFEGIPINISQNFVCDNFVDLTNFLKTNIDGIVKFKLNAKILKDKELYNFLNKYFEKSFERVVIKFETLKLYLEKLELKKNLKVSNNTKSSKLIKKPYL